MTRIRALVLAALSALGIVPSGAWCQSAGAVPAALPAAVVDLRTDAGVRMVQAVWR
jgi:hypothetical protein